MAKDAYFFPHDYNARNDRKLARLLLTHGVSGIGAYWCVVEMLYEEDGYLHTSDIPTIAKELRMKIKTLQDIIENFELFQQSEGEFFSLAVIARLKKRIAVRDDRQRAASMKWGNLAKINAQTRAQRLSLARKLGSHTDGEWAEMVEFFNNTCVKCRGESKLDEVVKDHIIPIYQGGSDAIFNLQPLCARCNARKGADITDYRLGYCHDIATEMPAKWLHDACTTTAIEKRREEDKREEDIKEGIVELPDWIKKETWSAFIEVRKKLRAPNTATATKLIIRKLDLLRSNGNDPNEVLNQSIINAYKGVFPLKGGSNGKTGQGTRALPTTYTDPADVRARE